MVTRFYETVVQENRNLAKMPIPTSIRNFDEYSSEFIKWFNDNYGLRGFFIRAKTQIDFTLFNMSTHLYIGKNQWLFYKNVIDKEQPAVELFLQKNADNVIAGIDQMAQDLKKKNIQLIISVQPMKNVFYGDQLPNGIKPPTSDRQVNYLIERLKVMGNIIFINSFSLLQNAVGKREIFHKTDFHWNDPAAYEVAKNLVDQLCVFEKKPLLWNRNLEIEIHKISGGEAMFMPIFFPPSEDALMVKKNWKDPPSVFVEKIKPFEWVYEQKPVNSNSLSPMVVLGDSFFDGMVRSGLLINFKKVSKAHLNSVQFSELLTELPQDTRYVFIEFIEVSLGVYQQFANRAIKNDY